MNKAEGFATGLWLFRLAEKEERASLAKDAFSR